MNCNCSTNETYEDECVFCHVKEIKLMDNYTKSKSCKQHGMILFCGPCEYVCKTCTDLGWYSTAGTGGGTYHRNHITGEKK